VIITNILATIEDLAKVAILSIKLIGTIIVNAIKRYIKSSNLFPYVPKICSRNFIKKTT